MKLRPSIVLVGLAALLVGGGVALRTTAPAPELRPATGSKPLVVATHRVRTESERARVELAGLLEARRQVELFAEGSGRVLEIGAEELDAVEAGQLLLRVDPVSAEVAVLRAEATLARAESELALARTTLKRQRKLAGNAVASEQVLEEAENGERVALAALREAQAVLREARDQREKRTLVAAFDGVLRTFSPEQGEYVNVGQKIGELLDTHRVRITVGLSDREVVDVHPGELARVLVEARAGELFEGRVTRIGGASDSLSRKFPVQLEIDNEQGRLLPGMVARVILELGGDQPHIAVPRESVMEEYGLRFVWLVESSGELGLVARRRPVEVRALPFHPAELEVLAGLSEGEEIALTGLSQLGDGSALRRREELATSRDLAKP